MQESYQRLTIHVQRSDTRFSVSKTAMANKTTRNVLTVWLKNKLSGMAGHQVLVVTYKGYAKELWDALRTSMESMMRFPMFFEMVPVLCGKRSMTCSDIP